MLAASAVAFAGPGGGTISGKVTYEGTPAKMKQIDMSKEPSCAKMYTTPPLVETVVTGSGNSLQDVVVYISAGAPDEAAPSNAAVFTQKGCRYIPHVLAFEVNQELKIVNDYLEIEKARFGARLRYSIEVPDEFQKAEVPPFALQILVENSVK